MPISGPANYPSTIAEFLAHWENVNTQLGEAGELVIAGGVTRADLEELGEELDGRRDAVTDAGVDRALARENLTTRLTLLQARAVEFNGRVRADLPASAFTRVLPEAFSIGEGEAKVRENLRKMARIWSKLNELSPVPLGLVLPLSLRDGFALTEFNVELEALRVAYQALSEADVELKLARELRNDSQDAIYVILKHYRLKVPQSLPLGNALVESLPALTPAPGHTPDAVAAAVEWDAVAKVARVTWAASTEATLAGYEVRGVPGGEYETQDEVLVARVEATAARVVETGFALTAAGVMASFKVYVILTTGNERGSEPVTVVRVA